MENTSFHNFRNPRSSKLSRNLAPQYENSTTRTASCNELCGECPCNKETVQWEPTCSMRTDRQMVGEADGCTERRTDRDNETNSPFSQFFERGQNPVCPIAYVFEEKVERDPMWNNISVRPLLCLHVSSLPRI